MAQEVTIAGATYQNVPSIRVPDSNAVYHSFVDSSDATATADKIIAGYSAYVNGEKVVGTAPSGGGSAISVVDTTDAAGGTIRTITAVDLSSDTVTAAHLENGYTAHDSYGNAIVGQMSPGGTINLETKSVTYTPSTSQQTDTVTYGSGYDGLDEVNVTINAMPSGSAGTPSATKGTVSSHSIAVTPSVTNTTGYITGGTKTGTAVTVSASELVSGNLPITSNGTNIDVTNYATVSVDVQGGTSKNIQAYQGSAETNATSLSATTVTLTVSKAGDYKCSWCGWRSNGSGTFSSRLYKNGSAVGSDHTSFTRTYGQYCTETLTLAKNDVLVVRARSRGSSYYMCVANLVIVEQ